jgi:hypothetical protein
MWPWVIWCAVTFGWNFVNSLNSRAKNSASKTYNAVTTFTTSSLYLVSVLFAANLVLESRNSGQHTQLILAVVLYALASTAGSVAGQQFAIKFEKVHHINK